MSGRPRPPADPREHGFRLAWTSNAIMWSYAARRLLRSGHHTDAQLGFVAFYFCVKLTSQLVNGRRSPMVPADLTARGDCPVARRRLRALADRLRGFRNGILHWSDNFEEGSAIATHWTAGSMVLETSTGGSSATLTREEVEALLDRLEPWLARHYQRLLEARPD